MSNRRKSVLESIVIIAILLVIVQTFLEDFAVLIGWSWNLRMILVFTGFFFDFFFTVEFLARLYSSVYHGKGGRYLLRESGWIDFMASIPLLLLSSGPAVLAVVRGGSAIFAIGGMLNLLKVVKAVRIARILRLLRMLKLFKQIKYADSVMAQRHVAKITAMTVTLFVVLLFLSSFVLAMLDAPSVDKVINDRQNRSVQRIVSQIPNEPREARNWLAGMTGSDDLLLVKKDGTTLFTRYNNDYYVESFGPSDYYYVGHGDYDFFFDIRNLVAIQSKDNLVYLGIVVLFVFFLLVYYGPHFALTVTDPITVMRKGMEDDSYNLEVKIPKRYEEDDVYCLADAYNRVFLPLKDRSRVAGEGRSSLLDLDDVKGLLEDE